MKKTFLLMLMATGIVTSIFAERKNNFMTANSKKETVITADMSSAQVDSIAGILKKEAITLEIKKIEFNAQHKIQKLEGVVSSTAKRLPFATDKFNKLEIFYSNGLDIKLYSK